jgi:uncharacterized membrane protein
MENKVGSNSVKANNSQVKTNNSQNNQNSKTQVSFGNRASDAIAKWAGSWFFILSFVFVLVFWMILNVRGWIGSWDPYPFILLNLVLSCVAAIQAPIILMSQNRQTEKDRKKLEYDYSVNRKSERGIEDIQKRLLAIERKLGKK